ncbi:MAG TPA: DUF4349 domain-containing protein, partial [Pyrinomonadaceae bacterium]|nr:DUF4349 domain-containing protein [Pyrinomonadaceae bacterium]
MNKIFLTSLIFASMALVGCGSTSSTRQTANKPSNSNGVSFGVYDIASSGLPSFLPDAEPATVAQRNLASDTNSGGGGGGAKEAPVFNAIVTKAPAVSLNQAVASQSNSIPSDRKIIQNAELSLESEQPEEAQKRIATIVQSKSGFVVESQQSGSDLKANRRDIVQMTVRVPAEKFTETLDEIRTVSSRVIVETIKGQDVTEEFIDIEARLKAQKALERQFMEIMKRANTVEDALNVQGQLADVRGEIEKVEGRKRFLENQATLSTIKIRLQTPAVFSTNSAGFFYRLSESFGNGFDFALDFMLGLVTFIVGVLPFAVFIGIPAYLI